MRLWIYPSEAFVRFCTDKEMTRARTATPGMVETEALELMFQRYP